MSFEGIDEWDENFLDEAIRIELEAISSRNPISVPSEQRPIASSKNPTSSFRPEHEPFSSKNPTSIRLEQDAFASFGFDGGGANSIVSFSPPRELSQRFPEKPESSYVAEDCEIIELGVLRNGVHDDRGGGGITRKDKEVERLKRELGRASKHLSHLERECVELQKDRSKKDEQLKCAFSQIDAKNAEIHSLKRANLEASKQDHFQSSLQLTDTGVSNDQATPCPMSQDKCNGGIPQNVEKRTKRLNGKSKRAIEPTGELSLDTQILDCYGSKRKDVQTDGLSAVSELKRRIMIDNCFTTSSGGSAQESLFPQKAAQSKCSKAIGIQTEPVQYCSQISQKSVTLEHDTSSKLLAIWGFPSDKKPGRILVSKLFETCSADFCVLFRCMSMPSKINLDSWADESFSDLILQDGMPSIQSIDAAKVSRLYAILMKMRNEMAELHHLLEALLDLCTLENVALGHSSLRILHAILQHLLSCDIRSDGRNNVLVDQSRKNSFVEEISGGQTNQIVGFHKSGKAYNEIEISRFSSLSMRSLNLENLHMNEDGSSSNSKFLSFESWLSLFETMRQIATRNKEEHIRIEAISIMNLILMRSNPISEREKFGLMPLLESVSHLLRKGVGMHVQKQAVHLLFLLLNCPKMLRMFCSGHKDDVEHSEAVDGQKDVSALQGVLSCILEGLAECLACRGTGTQELKLRTHVIVTLAFIASSGKLGFEVLMHSATPQRLNFLELIIRVLALEVDAEVADFTESRALCKERASLMREALILLNRLASHPAYSKAALGMLTSSNTTASLTIDVPTRISRKSRGCWKHEGRKKTQVEVEIVDLARLFRTRVLAFLGESIS